MYILTQRRGSFFGRRQRRGKYNGNIFKL